MPLFLAPLVGWLVGLGLAWAARADRGWEEAPLVTSRPLVVTLAFAAFVYAPVVGYFAAFHGDWAYLYLAPGRAIPSAVDLALVIFSGATVPLGLAIGARAVRAHEMTPLVKLGAGPAFVTLAVALVFARRLVVSGSYAQYHGHFGTEPITSSALGRGVLAGGLAVSIAAMLAVRALKRPVAR